MFSKRCKSHYKNSGGIVSSIPTKLNKAIDRIGNRISKALYHYGNNVEDVVVSTMILLWLI